LITLFYRTHNFETCRTCNRESNNDTFPNHGYKPSEYRRYTPIFTKPLLHV